MRRSIPSLRLGLGSTQPRPLALSRIPPSTGSASSPLDARAIPSRGIPRVRVGDAAANSSYAPARGANGAVQHSYTLREIDKLLTSIARISDKTSLHPSPLAMRSHRVPWLSSATPNLASASSSASASASAEGTSGTSSADKHAPPPLSEAERQQLLEPKHMSESFTSFDLPLKSDPELFQRYVNQMGGFRMGMLLEHLDSLAGAVAYRHCLPPPASGAATPQDATSAFHDASSRAGLFLATASADRLDMLGRLNRDNVRDLRFSGFVTWTGNSSMEVVVKMQGSTPAPAGTKDTAQAEGHAQEDAETLMLGRFVMVCRDSTTNRARKVPPLLVETAEEKMLWDIGEDYQRRRKATSQASLDKVPPSSAEAAHLHDLMIQVNDPNVDEIDGEKIVRMKDTELQSVQLMFPQDRNLHGKVFGGFLMRLAFEQCFTNAAIFASEPMRFLSLDQITFRLPVPIGAVLRLTSKVVKTTQPQPHLAAASSSGTGGEGADGSAAGHAKAHILVRAEVEEVETGIRRETNTFYFTMAKEDTRPIGKTVVPATYHEAMSYLEGERRLRVGDEMRWLYNVNTR